MSCISNISACFLCCFTNQRHEQANPCLEKKTNLPQEKSLSIKNDQEASKSTSFSFSPEYIKNPKSPEKISFVHKILTIIKTHRTQKSGSDSSAFSSKKNIIKQKSQKDQQSLTDLLNRHNELPNISPSCSFCEGSSESRTHSELESKIRSSEESFDEKIPGLEIAVP